MNKDEFEFDLNDFLLRDKVLLKAPAGYGKTHTIASSISSVSGRQLILTHTHAGVTSILEKIKKLYIDMSLVDVETISSFFKRYVIAYNTKDNIPDVEDSKIYWSWINTQMCLLVSSKLFIDIFKAKYTGLYIDEYQDCTLEQHSIIISLSKIVKTRICGDPLQGIFDFSGTLLVDMDNESSLEEFRDNSFELKTPRRWQDTNPSLGDDLKKIRLNLENEEEVDFKDYKSISFFKIKNDLRTEYVKQITNLLSNSKNILILLPQKNMIKKFNNGFGEHIRPRIIEAIDDEDFYKYAKGFDFAENKTEFLLKIIRDLCYKTNGWINKKNRLVIKNDLSKLSIAEQNKYKYLRSILLRFEKSENQYKHSKFLKYIIFENNIFVPIRKELVSSLIKAIDISITKNISVYESMKFTRDNTRRYGRKLYGRLIGTTLLTKGLECDKVIIINADAFDKKNLYVALTRATKELIIFSKNSKIKPK